MFDHVKILSCLAAIAIVGGALYALDQHFPDDLLIRHDSQHDQTESARSQSLQHGTGTYSKSTSEAPLPADTASRAGNPENQSGSKAKSIYRCTQNGKITYTETPCHGGTTVDVQVSRGVDTGQDMRRSQNAVNSLQQLARSQEPAAQTSNGTRHWPNNDRHAECKLMSDRILWIDAASRQQNSLQRLEYLKNERKQVRDRQHRLGC